MALNRDTGEVLSRFRISKRAPYLTAKQDARQSYGDPIGTVM